MPPDPTTPPRPPTFLDSVERILLRVILFALLVLALLLGFAAWHARQQRNLALQTAPASSAPAATSISLIIDYGDGTRKSFTDLAAPQSMTVLDAMNAAKTHARPLAFITTGSGATTLLTSIDDVANEGVGASSGKSRNWQYWIDAAYGTSSIGVATVKPGQRITWAFRPYESDPKPPAP